MTLRTFFPSLATHGTNRGDEERGLEIFPEDTLEEVPVGDSRIYVDNDLEVLNEEDADYIVEEPNDNNYAPRQRQFSSATAFNSFSKSFLSVETPTWLEHIKTFVFPPKENIESFIPNYRQIPIISGLLIPFSMCGLFLLDLFDYLITIILSSLLQIPGVTVRWYIRTENSQVVQSRANPILDVCLAFSLACALLANMCLITRFLEKRVKTMTIFCTVFLTIHGTPCCIVVDRLDYSLYRRYYQHRGRDSFRCRASFQWQFHLWPVLLDDNLLYNRVIFHKRYSPMGSLPNPRLQQKW